VKGYISNLRTFLKEKLKKKIQVFNSKTEEEKKDSKS